MTRIFILAASLLVFSSPSLAGNPFSSICPDKEVVYCGKVGKTAYNSFGPAALRAVNIGPIVGVAYKLKGALISRPESSSIQLASKNSYYYIIGPGGVADYYFLRDVSEIDGK
ncbi:hypothetical protein [Mariprofundus sp. KV]|uniref:hypothetical protein n=1 Tax=Mariprofundus sp. KV TaxID=2608715 RepID=UPI0015A1EB8E|nr:hypothetical protein [Mariprofundus sp. KV]NWF37512.1 hypothetical protein [Mariprofundus sp. KV]